MVTPYREETSVHDHHRKKIFWGTFLASKKKLSRPVVDTKNLLKNRKPFHHRNLSSVDPVFFFCKEKFCTGLVTGVGRCMVSFSQP